MADAFLAVWWRRPFTASSGAFLDRLARLLESESPRAYRLCACLLAAIFIVIGGDLIILGAAPIAAPWDVMCMLDGAWRMVSGQILLHHFDPSRLLHSARLRDFRVPAAASHITSYWPARDHPVNINDGIDLLRKNLQPGDRVTTVAFANPFSFALGLQPARDANIFWDLGFSFDESHAPGASEFLGDASVIMVPRLVDRSQGWNFDSADALMRLYGAYLRSNFTLIDTSRVWLLYRRRSEPAAVQSHS